MSVVGIWENKSIYDSITLYVNIVNHNSRIGDLYHHRLKKMASRLLSAQPLSKAMVLPIWYVEPTGENVIRKTTFSLRTLYMKRSSEICRLFGFGKVI